MAYQRFRLDDGNCVRSVMLQFVTYNGHTYRVLLEENNVSWIISYEHPSAPKGVLNNALTPTSVPKDLYIEETCSVQRKNVQEKRFEIVKPLIEADECIYNKSLRNKLFVQIAETYDLSTKTVSRLYFAFLAKGEKGLLPQKRKREKKKDENIDVDMRKAISKYYYSPRKYSLRMAYESYLMDHWCSEDGTLALDYPPFSRFLRNYRNTKDEYRKIISREGIGEYQRNYRPLLGKTEDVASKCGVFEIDATVADIHLVSKYSRKPIGRPVVYLAVDVVSRLITGVHVGLDTNADAALLCMRSMVENKVDLCKEYGIDIATEQWPSIGLPSVLLTDRGTEFVGKRVKELCRLFDMEITNLPAYRPDLKGCVEKAFDCIQRRYKTLLKGKGTIEQQTTREGRVLVQSEACFDLFEFTQILLRCILYYNSSQIQSCGILPELIAAGVPPTPCLVWKWLSENGLSATINADSDTLSMMLLPRSEGSITRQGLLFNGLRYDCPTKDFTKRYVAAGIGGYEKVCVAYDTSNVGYIYLLENDKYYRFELTTASIAFTNVSFDEIRLMQKEEKELRNKAEKIQNREAVNCAAHIKQISNNAKNQPKHGTKDISQGRIKKERMKEKDNE